MDLEKSKPASNFCEQNTIEKLNLSVRTYNCLRRAGINTIEELFAACVQGKLFNVRTFGIKTYEEIKKSIFVNF